MHHTVPRAEILWRQPLLLKSRYGGGQWRCNFVWLDLINRGGFFRVNDGTFAFFVSVEEAIHQYFQLKNVRALTMKSRKRLSPA